MSEHHNGAYAQNIIDNAFRDVGTLILKVTNRCNIDCSYCYEKIEPKGSYMPLDVFNETIKRAFSASRRRKIMVVLHGGEPSLLDETTLRAMVASVCEACRLYSKEAGILMQTNLIRFDDQKAALYQQLGITLGVSLDGPDTLSKPERIGARHVTRNFLRARALGLCTGVLTTINKSNSASFASIMRWLHEDVQVREFKANVAYAVGRGINAPPLTAEEIFEAQKSILDHMITNVAHGGPIEQNISEYICRFIERSHGNSLCNQKTCGAGHGVLSINMSGDILPCGRFEWDDHFHYIGQVRRTGIDSDRLDNFQAMYSSNWQNCDTCEARGICSFGCQAFIVRTKAKINIECTPTKMLFSYMSKRKADVLSLYILLKEQEYFPKEVKYVR